MDPFGPVALPLKGSCEWIPIGGFASRRALDQAYGLAVGNVNGRQEFKVVSHAGHPRDLTRSSIRAGTSCQRDLRRVFECPVRHWDRHPP